MYTDSSDDEEGTVEEIDDEEDSEIESWSSSADAGEGEEDDDEEEGEGSPTKNRCLLFQRWYLEWPC